MHFKFKLILYLTQAYARCCSCTCFWQENKMKSLAFIQDNYCHHSLCFYMTLFHMKMTKSSTRFQVRMGFNVGCGFMLLERMSWRLSNTLRDENCWVNMVEDVELLDKQFDPTTTLYFQQKVNNFFFLVSKLSLYRHCFKNCFCFAVKS